MNVEGLKDYLGKKDKLGVRTVTLFLMNGFQMRGTIMKMDEGWLVFLDNQNQEKTVFYHAISTIE